MLEKNVQNRNQVEIICIEDLVPQDHLLRKIERAVDFKKQPVEKPEIQKNWISGFSTV